MGTCRTSWGKHQIVLLNWQSSLKHTEDERRCFTKGKNIIEFMKGKKVKFSELHKAGCKGRATSVGEAVEVTCPEHNHPADQASNKRFIEKGQTDFSTV